VPFQEPKGIQFLGLNITSVSGWSSHWGRDARPWRRNVTKNKKQKKLIRERAARSGTRYTTAMRSLAPKKAGHAEVSAAA
jgi:hypothetical protein